MKRAVMLLFVVALFSLAQTSHSVTLTWNDALNPAGTTYNIYRASGQCSGSPTFAKITTTPLTVKTYVDNSVVPGSYCYVATAVYNAVESVYSNSAPAAVPSFAPSGLTVVVQ